MSGVPLVTKGGPKTFTPASGVSIKGGQLVEGAASGRIAIAGVGSFKHLGVALMDCIAPENVVTTPTTDSFGRPVLGAYPQPTNTPVAYSGDETTVTYAADAVFGAPLIAAANGTVTPAGSTPDARFLVGKCTEPLGVTVSANAVGLMRIA